MTFANRGTVHFATEQDRALLCAVDKCGYGNWDQVRETLINDENLMMQHTAQCMNIDAIIKRVDYRMRQLERELEAREKKMRNDKPAAVIAAEKAIEAIKEMDEWEEKAFDYQMRGEDPPTMALLTDEAKNCLEECLRDRQIVTERFREIEIQLRGCRDLSSKTYEAIMRGDQYVNYSHITLKSGGQHITDNGNFTDLDGIDMEAYVNKFVLAVPECGKCRPCTDNKVRKLCVKRQEVREEKLVEFDKKMKEWIKTGAKRTKSLEKDKDGNRQYWPRKRGSDALSTKSSNGNGKVSSVFKKKISPPGNPLGNKRMSVPDEILPDFCRRISAQGTRKRMDTINEFVRDHPAVSIRQVTFKFAEITTRDRPPCVPKAEKPKGKGRAFIFYLRPKYYSLLPENERPEKWEKYMKDDEVLFQEEKRKEKEEKAKKDRNLKEMKDDATVSSLAETNSLATSRSIDLDRSNGNRNNDEDDDMTEDEAEPPTKKLKG